CGDVAAPDPADEVRALRAFGHDVLELPPEQPAVEGQGSLRVGLVGVDPARDTGDVTVSLRHVRLRSARVVECDSTRGKRSSPGQFCDAIYSWAHGDEAGGGVGGRLRAARGRVVRAERAGRPAAAAADEARLRRAR